VKDKGGGATKIKRSKVAVSTNNVSGGG